MTKAATDYPATRRQVENYLKKQGISTSLHQSKGCLYFWGDREAGWFTSSVAVARVSHLSLGGWLAAYRQLEADFRNRD